MSHVISQEPSYTEVKFALRHTGEAALLWNCALYSCRNRPIRDDRLRHGWKSDLPSHAEVDAVPNTHRLRRVEEIAAHDVDADLRLGTSAAGGKSLPAPSSQRFSDGPFSAVSMPDFSTSKQILV